LDDYWQQQQPRMADAGFFATVFFAVFFATTFFATTFLAVLAAVFVCFLRGFFALVGMVARILRLAGREGKATDRQCIGIDDA
jgi:hypothetical protein